MMNTTSLNNIESPTRYRAVWLSDVHLGSRDCQAERLLRFLQQLDCDTLYLLGDIVDLWALKKQLHWPAMHQRVLDEFARLAQRGVRVIYIPGNHDCPLRNYAGGSLFGVEVHRRFVHRTADGKRLLLLHGDEFDAATRYNRLHRLVGDTAYDLLLWLNRCSNRLRHWSGRPYWSLAGWLKTRVRTAQAAVTAFEEAALEAARAYPADGIVCGHIHQAALRHHDGMIYANDGDWVESCTVLAEHADGRLELLQAAALTERRTRPVSTPANLPVPGLS